MYQGFSRFLLLLQLHILLNTHFKIGHKWPKNNHRASFTKVKSISLVHTLGVVLGVWRYHFTRVVSLNEALPVTIRFAVSQFAGTRKGWCPVEGDGLNEKDWRIVEFDRSYFRKTFSCRRFKCPIETFPFQLSRDLDLIQRIRIEIAQHSKGLIWNQLI